VWNGSSDLLSFCKGRIFLVGFCQSFIYQKKVIPTQTAKKTIENSSANRTPPISGQSSRNTSQLILSGNYNNPTKTFMVNPKIKCGFGNFTKHL
jgi:hypothetical protein